MEKHVKIGFGLALIALGFVVFFGIPIYYKYQTYTITEHPNVIDEIEFVFGIYPSSNAHFLGLIPIKEGNPYEVGIVAYGEKDLHKSIKVNSLMILDKNKSLSIIEHRNSTTYGFIAHSIWLTRITPDKSFELDFIPGSKITMKVDMDIEYFDKVKNIKANRHFVATEEKGWRFLSLIQAIAYI